MSNGWARLVQRYRQIFVDAFLIIKQLVCHIDSIAS